MQNRLRLGAASGTTKCDLEVPDLRWSVDGSGHYVASVGRQLNAVDADLFGRHQVGRRRCDQRPGEGYLPPPPLLLLLLLLGERNGAHLIAGVGTRRRGRTSSHLLLSNSQLSLLLEQLTLLLEQDLLLMMQEASVQRHHRAERGRLNKHHRHESITTRVCELYTNIS